MKPQLFHCPGEPAGVGPELLIKLCQRPAPGTRIAVANGAMLDATARQLGLPLMLSPWRPGRSAPQGPGELQLIDLPLPKRVRPGQPEPDNAVYLLDCLRRAADAASQRGAAMVTGPLNKAVINAAGLAFSGHTEFLAAHCGAGRPVMMLLAGSLRVALVTTHLPLRAVPDAITPDTVRHSLRVLIQTLQSRFRLRRPRIQVLGLNPHAGESGHLGHEDASIIAPAMAELAVLGAELMGPVPADTAFTPERLARCDAVLAMYHDQGLPVLKHRGFGQAVNLTLNLPIIRTSVDHGTALDIAGQGRADPGSLSAAEALAAQLATA